ncbi:hypothetical protein ANI02nite_36490 [Acetobacter nitrogenifigens DSM 23921 = NBRC 105050]|uniref:Uncharacterized protein n=1 Tax=Acetobacter nitrogenifigens DSM 23921 = NBRC 105050 TaxID=1120919 RepID=A0A511XFS4_9PROT|nr:hypothetical protein ANI02nite_36490 [Acetobacter nitrogenifigens DSM 23921 = NBRC 105050]
MGFQFGFIHLKPNARDISQRRCPAHAKRHHIVDAKPADRVVEKRHYKLVSATQLDAQAIRDYR